MSTNGINTHEAARASRAQIAQDEARRRAEANRAGRAVDNATKKSSGSRRRSSKAPKSASQYHYRLKFSKRNGNGNSPKSAINKIKYDFVMDVKDSENSRLGYTYVSAPPNTPESALNPVVMAKACEDGMHKKSNLNARMMGHAEVSLPKELNEEQRQELIRNIADFHCKEMKVPVYVAEHKPDKGNDNWHVHISFPIRQVHATKNNGFVLGDRIIQYARPEVRIAAGLPKKDGLDLRRMRTAMGNLIADSLVKAKSSYEIAERWRYGYLQLSSQVEKAIERGDVEFVADNATRDPQKKEGYSTSQWRNQSFSEQRQYAIRHNENIRDGDIGAALLTRTLFNRIMELAERAGITEPEHLRMLARDKGLSIEWVQSYGKKCGKMVTGMRVQMNGGPKLTGMEAGTTLHDLKRRFGWKDAPIYYRYPARNGKDFDRYAGIVQKSGLGVIPGQDGDSTEQAIKAVLRIKERQITRATIVAGGRGEAASAERAPLGEIPKEDASGERLKIQNARQGTKKTHGGDNGSSPMEDMAQGTKDVLQPSTLIYEPPQEEAMMNKYQQRRARDEAVLREWEENRKRREEKQKLEDQRWEQEFRQSAMQRSQKIARAIVPSGVIIETSKPESLQDQLDKLNVVALQNQEMQKNQYPAHSERQIPRPRG